MIEVIGQKPCFRWRFISDNGRTLYESYVCYPTDLAAHEAAKLLRGHFNEHAPQIDRAE